MFYSKNNRKLLKDLEEEQDLFYIYERLFWVPVGEWTARKVGRILYDSGEVQLISNGDFGLEGSSGDRGKSYNFGDILVLKLLAGQLNIEVKKTKD